jgi:hypothetical protein
MAKSDRTLRLEWWKFIVGSILVVLSAIVIPLIINYKEELPRFGIVNIITRPDSIIIIKAKNESAFRERKLDVEFDGFRFDESGIPVPKTKPQLWHFSLKKQIAPEFMLKRYHSCNSGWFSRRRFLRAAEYLFWIKRESSCSITRNQRRTR